MRVGYYYTIPARVPVSDPNSNPYGTLLSEALERRGIAVEYTIPLDEEYLRRNQGRVNVLHLNWPHYMYSHDDAATMAQQMRQFVGSMELARELGYKLVWTAHNLYPHDHTHLDIDRQCRFEICRLATAIIAHCPAAAAGLREHFGRSHNLFVVPHGNFLGIYSCPLTHRQARAQLGLPADAFVYASVGIVRPYKGIERLIDVFRHVSTADAWLVISGGSKDTAYLESIRRRAAGHQRIVLHFGLPRLSNDDFLIVPQAADVIVQPYVAATTSSALILAMGWQRPVIAPALGCLPDLVTPASGILYDPSDENALPDALTAIRSFDLAAAGRAALEVVSAAKYSWDEIARLTIEAYEA